MRRRSPGHLKTFDYLGLHRYSITFCTDARAPYFMDPDRVDLVLTQIVRAAASDRFAIITFCFMPDHMHLLVQASSDDADGRKFIVDAKRYSGFHFAKEYRQRLWQRYCFERVLRDEEGTHAVARYILNNPVRGGLVSSADEYPFVGSMTHSLDELLRDSSIWSS